MTDWDLMRTRHSVRQYLDLPLPPEALEELTALVGECNRAGGLHIQLVQNEEKAFSGLIARYGRFSGVRNYFALVGKKGPSLEEKCGYYGEKLVLRAQALGLNTCWVAGSYSRVPDAYEIADGEKLVAVIAVGIGAASGRPHRSKAPAAVSNVSDDSPEWFRRGVEAALLAPTAMNQQNFRFTFDGEKLRAEAGLGFYTKLDLGIVKYHFELGAGKGRVRWLFR
ncbi:MAG: nitroreductase [Oscillospiraceae bacterium]|nr:nitroreductase [Oscillospiraceae bacterium]